MHLLTPTLAFLSLLPSALAAGTCASSGSLSWPPVSECNNPTKYPTAVQTCRACCLNDQPCVTACLRAAGIGARDASSGVIQRRNVDSRAIALTCATNEGCYKFMDGSLLCLNLGTGLYHDEVGENGDFFSGKYTGPDGRVQTGTGSAAATVSLARSSSAVTKLASTTSLTTKTTAAGLATSAGVASASVGAGSASTGNARAAASSAAAVFLGANVGLVGLVAGLIV